MSITKLGGAALNPREAPAGSGRANHSGFAPSTVRVVIQVAACLGLSTAGVLRNGGALQRGNLVAALSKPRDRPSMGTACYIPM